MGYARDAFRLGRPSSSKAAAIMAGPLSTVHRVPPPLRLFVLVFVLVVVLTGDETARFLPELNGPGHRVGQQRQPQEYAEYNIGIPDSPKRQEQNDHESDEQEVPDQLRFRHLPLEAWKRRDTMG